MRIPSSSLRPGSEEDDAQRYAADCDHCCRLLEVAVEPDVLARAERLGAVTAPQATALREGTPAPSHRARPAGPLTLVDAAQRHPSTLREAERRPEEHARHLRELQFFQEWSGIRALRDLTLRHVIDWIAHLKGRGYRWDGRRHRLLYIRRAAAMAASEGLPDVLAGMVLDARDQREEIEVEAWTMGELHGAARRLLDLPDRRVLAILALGGFCGLRSSEIARARVGHLSEDGVLSVGREERKTRASRRDLPLPPTVLAWIRPLCLHSDTGEARAPSDYLIRGRGNQHRDRPMTPRRMSELWSPAVAPLTQHAHLTPKHLRKSWLTWAVRSGLDLTLVEAWVGHRASLILPVTSAHYLVAAQVALFRGIRDAIEAALAAVTAPPRRRRRTAAVTAPPAAPAPPPPGTPTGAAVRPRRRSAAPAARAG